MSTPQVATEPRGTRSPKPPHRGSTNRSGVKPQRFNLTELSWSRLFSPNQQRFLDSIALPLAMLVSVAAPLLHG